MGSAPVASMPAAAAPAVSPVASSAPSKAELAEAEKHAKLLVWAAKTTAAQGSPQAGLMQAKADAAVAALEALKAAGSAPSAPSPPLASASVASAPVASVPVSGAPTKQELAQAKKQLDLVMWAARVAAEKGVPQAAAMKAKADAALTQYKAMEPMAEQKQMAMRCVGGVCMLS